ncbi:HNH endonuclease signature motif containing protein [Herbihabitans rhizosphaerae]|uniref:HNH endonuclease signature motif containing protein n=1 Tax=Herbihabitans rhizosphaerae TaxID=1872711 RepID=UPI0013EE5DFD|nr:HNH endonuclease signature motif containing protein [Herbihabitans rhizosphaerae]
MSWDAVLEAAPRVFGEPEFDFSDGPFTSDEASTVAELEIVERDKAALCADEVRLLAQYNQLRAGAENVSEEIGQALKWSPGHASHQMVMAEALVTRLPQTLAALARGEIDWAKARAMYEVTRPLSDEHAARVEAAVLADPPDYYTPFQRKVRYWVNKVDPDGAEQRRLVRRKDRCVTFKQDEDGEAFLGIRGPVEQLYPAYVRIDQHARRLKQQGDTRSLDNLRFDVAVEHFCGENPSHIKTIVWVTVPHTTLMGVDDKPGELFGVDTLPAQVVRELAADQKSTWRRILYDPPSGMITDVGRKRYPPAAMAENVRLRFRRCTHPGCDRPATRCHIDHTLRHADHGRTCLCNLNPRCERHNLCKEQPGWQVEQPEPDVVITRSPLGHKTTVRAQPIADPDPPPY